MLNTSAWLLIKLENDYRTFITCACIGTYFRLETVRVSGVMLQMNRWILIAFCAIFLGGCNSYETRTYDVTVKNAGPEAVTVWLTKDGEPYEQAWLSPEDLIIESPKSPKKEISGVVIPAGKVANTGPRVGQFREQTHAILRVYEGQMGMNELLATKPGAARVDLELSPGKSEFVVKTDDHIVTVQRSGQ
jgi:hypothetical protein